MRAGNGDPASSGAIHPRFEALGIHGLPEIRDGDDLAQLLAGRFVFVPGDVLVIAQKIVSKAEGRLVALATVKPSSEARRLARQANKDPRVVQLILDESRRVVRVRPGLIIVEDRRGWICANAGIDRSNVEPTASGDVVCLLPEDADESASRIRSKLSSLTGFDVGVLVNDSHGRAWRDGTVGVAIGAAGVEVLSDRRGDVDRHGYVLAHTIVGRADELASAASILMGQAAESVPAVVLRGLDVSGEGDARSTQRPPELDLFR